MTEKMEKKRLTSFANGGGCGSKLEPYDLSQVLKQIPVKNKFKNLIVGIENSDDAAVFQFNKKKCLVFTDDFHTPIVDDPYLFGRIASANAISDVYAMGAKPFMATAIAGFPTDEMSNEDIARVMKGASDLCLELGVALAGGHTIKNQQPIYGLACVGKMKAKNIKRNNDAQIGDAIILTKPLGIGVLATALKIGFISDFLKDKFEEAVTGVNTDGAWLGKIDEVHGMTDVTGFGATGHLVEMAKGSGTHFEIDSSKIRFIEGVLELAKEGIFPSAAYKNGQNYDTDIVFNDAFTSEYKTLLSDPQTNGGLFLTVSQSKAKKVLNKLRKKGSPHAEIIGIVKEHEGKSRSVEFK